MTDENKTVDDNQAPEMKTVSFFGVDIELPKDKADEVIRVRDEKVHSYNEVSAKLSEITSKEEQARLEAQEAQRRADAAEAAKKGDLEEAESLFAQKHQEKLTKYEQHAYRSAVKTELLQRDDIVKSAVDDTLNQIVSSNKFELTDDFQVKAGDSSVADVVNNYIDARDYLKLASGNKPTNTPKSAGEVDTKNPKADMRKGLEKLIG